MATCQLFSVRYAFVYRFCYTYRTHRERKRERDREREIDEIDCYIDRTFRSVLDFNTKKLSALVASIGWTPLCHRKRTRRAQWLLIALYGTFYPGLLYLNIEKKNSAGHNSERSSAIADKLGDTIVCQCYSCAVVRAARAKARYTLPVSTTHVPGRVHGPCPRESF